MSTNKTSNEISEIQELYRKVGEQAIKEITAMGFFITPQEIAEEIYGKSTPEYEAAVQMIQVEKAKAENSRKSRSWKIITHAGEEGPYKEIRLKRTATVEDLFNAFEEADSNEDLGGDLLEDDLRTIFHHEMLDQFGDNANIAFLDAEHDLKKRTMKLLDFLEELKIDKSDFEAYLPIKFNKK